MTLLSFLVVMMIGIIISFLRVRMEEREAVYDQAEQYAVTLGSIGDDDMQEYFWNYLEEHSDEVRILSPEDREDSEKLLHWRNEHQRMVDAMSIKGEEVCDISDMSESDIRLLAESIYNSTISGLAELYVTKSKTQGIVIYRYTGDNRAFVFYSSRPDENNRYHLGEIIPFDLKEHPAVSRILKTDEPVMEVERFRDEDDGREHIYVPYPVMANGRVQCIVAMDYIMSNSYAELSDKVLRIIGHTLIYVMFADVILLILINFLVIRPLGIMQRGIRNYMKDKNSEDVTKELVKTNGMEDELGTLSRDITDLVHEIDRYLEEISAYASEKAKIEAQLDIATKIQAEALPRIFPAFPDRKEFDVYAYMRPTLAVGGDFYDFFLIDEDHLGLVIADVSGKGVPAALLMMVSKTMIESAACLKGDFTHPKDIFRFVNRSLEARNELCMFVTAWMGVLTISTGELVCSNAGHESPAIMRAGDGEGGFTLIQSRHSLPLAVYPDTSFSGESFVLNKGDVIFEYTDGVTEAVAPDGEMFGEVRLEAALNECADKEPREIINHVRERIREFIGENDQYDDITMLCLKYMGK